MGLRVGVLGVGPVGEPIVKILSERKFPVDGDVTIMATSERDEIINGNPVAVKAEFMEPMSADEAIGILSDPIQSPGVVCVDRVSESLEYRYPVPVDLEKDEWKDAVLVGRIRDDMTATNAINLWCVADNLRKGAATNAVQIAEGMIKKGWW